MVRAVAIKHTVNIARNILIFVLILAGFRYQALNINKRAAKKVKLLKKDSVWKKKMLINKKSRYNLRKSKI